MTDTAQHSCPYRSLDPIGTVRCRCNGIPEAYVCYHPDVNTYVMINRARLLDRFIRFADGTTDSVPSTRLTDCLTCKYRPTDASDLPPFRLQIVSFLGALGRHIKGGMKRVQPHEYNKRTKECLDCPRLTNEGRCTHCGCWVSEKALWASETCPEDKWPLLEATPEEQSTRTSSIQQAIEAICSNCPAECPGPSLAACPRDLWPKLPEPIPARRRRCGGCK